MSNVINGKNGYLFLAGDQNAVINQHTGNRPLKDRQLSKWKRVIYDRKRILKSKGIRYYLQIVPDKHPVYRQHLPDEFQLTTKRNIHLFLEHVEPVMKGRINYPLDSISSVSKQHKVYFKGDSHWTDYGAYIAYLELIKIIKNDIPNISSLKDPVFKPRSFQGDLARLIGINEEEPTGYFEDAPAVKTLFNNKVRNTGRIKLFTNPLAKNNLKILVFGSSSTLYTLKFLTHDFKDVIFYWSGNFDNSAINHYKPDVIFNQIRERHLIRPADDVVGLNTTEMAFVKSFADIGEAISPIPFNKCLVLESSLAKSGNKSNQAYQKYLIELCKILKLESIYNFSINIDRSRFPFRIIRLMIKSKLILNQLMAGPISSRLSKVNLHNT